MSAFNKFREEWLRPALFFGNNPISLAGGAITTGSGVTMISYWLAELSGHLSDNPYLGIIFFLFLPALFLLGLALIPISSTSGSRRSSWRTAPAKYTAEPRSISEALIPGITLRGIDNGASPVTSTS